LIRQIVQDFAILEDSKIIQDDDKFLVVKAVIASEIVHKYKDGMAYKPADELEKAAWTAEGRWVKALSHPTSDHIRNVNDINGRMENPTNPFQPKFTNKNLKQLNKNWFSRHKQLSIFLLNCSNSLLVSLILEIKCEKIWRQSL
jgi:hypothetical protein